MDNFIKMDCPSCGAKLKLDIFSNLANCEYCGKEIMLTGNTGIINSHCKCPICGDKDMVQKVSAMIHTGEPIVEHIRPPDKPRIPTYTEFMRTYKTESSSWSYDIDKPKKQNPWFFWGIGIFVFLIAVSSNPGDNPGTFFFFFFLSGILGFLGYRAYNYNKTKLPPLESAYNDSVARKPKVEDNSRDAYELMAKNWIQKWQLAMKRWEFLYYCKRDGILYVPGGDQHTTVRDMLNYLYTDDM